MALMLAEEQFYQEVPGHFAWDHMLRQPSFWDKVSEQRKGEHSTATRSCLESVECVVRQAVKDGDLELEEQRVRAVVLMLVAFALGQTMVTSAAELREYAKITESPQLLEEGLQTVLDGLGWRPLGREFDWKRRRPVLLRKLKSLLSSH